MYDANFKILLFGDDPEGKKILTQKYMINLFSEGHEDTIGVDFVKYSDKPELPQDYIWISIKVPNKITTFGVAVPLLKMRNPLEARKTIFLDS